MTGHSYTSSDRWPRVQALFTAALALPRGERPAFVAQEGSGDPSLVDEVMSLLRAHDESGLIPASGSWDSTRSRASTTLEAIEPVLADRYRFDGVAGEGGMAFVYDAWDLRHDRRVAIKVLRSDVVSAMGSNRFLNEIKVTAHLQHPHILPLYDSGQADGIPYFVMPMVTDGSLRELLEQSAPLPVHRVLQLGAQVARALDYAHRRGVIHRDIKPSNILLQEDQPLVADFGIALALSKATEPRLTQAGLAIGTPTYMSPEQAAGQTEIDARADVYALGCVLYECLTGKPPYSGTTPIAVIVMHRVQPIPAVSAERDDVSAVLDEAIGRAMAKNPEDRFPDCASMARALTDAAEPRSGLDHTGTQGTSFGGRPATRPLPSAPKQDIKFTHTEDGTTIAYASVGDGPPLVKVANWLSHLEYDWRIPMWRHWWQGLSEGHRLIRYDERGCGLSDWDVEDFSMDAWVNDLEAVVDGAGVDRFDLLGVSQGGPIALAYAVRHPERVRRVVLHGTYLRGTAYRDTASADRRRLELDLVRAGWGTENPAFRQVFSALFFPDSDPQTLSWFNELQRVSCSPENAIKIIEGFHRIDAREIARQVRAPTLVLHCRDEERVPFEEGRLTASTIPGARLVTLDSKNHIPLAHEPAWRHFLEEVKGFLLAPEL